MKWKSNKYIVLLLIGMICIVALLPGCFAREEIICSLGREELEKGIIVGEQGETFVGESFVLPPGVYQVRVAAQNTQNAVVTVEMKQYGGEYRSLRANSASLSAGQTREQFEVYVAATIKEGYLQADFSGCTHETIQEIQLVKLNWGNRMALCMVLAIVVLLMGVLSFRDRILAGKIEVSKQVAFWALLGGVFTAYYPYLTTYMNLGEETIFHLLRIEGLAETLLSGQQFPVRVQTNWMCDHGYLVSGFCSDLFLLIPAAIRMTGFSLMTSYKLFVFIVTAVTAWLAYLSFEKCTRNVYAAMTGALVYLLMPYRIYLCYHKGALDELVAMAFLPLVLSGIYLVFQGDKRAWGYLVTGLTGVLHG
ncbi:MAG: hypothetical protein IJF07_05780, partial [Lachnospiraceae bacterium]|nr:hypothetical protein [Lachnospiraceae bacterium]